MPSEAINTILMRLRVFQNPECVGKSDEQIAEMARLDHERVQTARLSRALEGWGVEANDRAPILQGVRDTLAVAHVREFAKQEAANTCVLWGGTGCGKSVAGALWLSAKAKAKVFSLSMGTSWTWDDSARFRPVRPLSKIATSFNPLDRAEFESLETARWLVLDDAIKCDARLQEAVEQLIYERNRRLLATLITTNLRPEEFRASYGDRICSRIEQYGGFRACGATDLRKRTP